MKPYLFLEISDNYLIPETQNYLSKFKEVHIHQKIFNEKILLEIKNFKPNNLYFYAFSETQVKFCIDNDIIPHICFKGDKIFGANLDLYLKSNYEIFWFPDKKQIENKYEFESLVARLKEINTPICISISNIFNPESANENGRIFIKNIHKQFKNKLFEKELDLLINQSHNDLNLNQFLFQNNGSLFKEFIILGIFGDMKKKDLIHKDNMKSLIRNKDCVGCKYLDFCINKGIGYIIKEYEFKGCISLNLFNN